MRMEEGEMSLAIWDEPGVKCWFMTCVGARLGFVKAKQDVGEQFISSTPGRGTSCIVIIMSKKYKNNFFNAIATSIGSDSLPTVNERRELSSV